MFLYGIAILFIILAIITLFIVLKSRSSSHPPTSMSNVDWEDLAAIDIHRLDLMADGSEFELYIARLLVELGYKGVYKTTGSRDFGADVVFIDSAGNQTVIQAKRYSVDNLVGLSAVQEVYTSKRFYKARNAVVITTSKYTHACETLAGVNHVLLLDRDDLIKIIELYRTGQYELAKQVIEQEPRVILESWTDMKEEYKVIKQDKKSDKVLKSSIG